MVSTSRSRVSSTCRVSAVNKAESQVGQGPGFGLNVLITVPNVSFSTLY